MGGGPFRFFCVIIGHTTFVIMWTQLKSKTVETHKHIQTPLTHGSCWKTEDQFYCEQYNFGPLYFKSYFFSLLFISTPFHVSKLSSSGTLLNSIIWQCSGMRGAITNCIPQLLKSSSQGPGVNGEGDGGRLEGGGQGDASATDINNFSVYILSLNSMSSCECKESKPLV